MSRGLGDVYKRQALFGDQAPIFVFVYLPNNATNGTPFEAPLPVMEAMLPVRAGRPPLQCPPNRFEFETATGHASDRAPPGVPGPHLCRIDLPVPRPAQHKCRPGSLGKRAPPWFSRFRGRPPALDQRGRSPLRLPSRDRADRATLGDGALQRPIASEGRGFMATCAPLT